ncbi:MXAN_6640 family putative metalloprotease [Nocardioides sp. KR10-350]|uniref:MXAN_6640 family putative metalloprotease n=1 Tax=Nocardioides cheoyonin TaxID=3156615 RepID=UPI0032B3D981
MRYRLTRALTAAVVALLAVPPLVGLSTLEPAAAAAPPGPHHTLTKAQVQRSFEQFRSAVAKPGAASDLTPYYRDLTAGRSKLTAAQRAYVDRVVRGTSPAVERAAATESSDDAPVYCAAGCAYDAPPVDADGRSSLANTLCDGTVCLHYDTEADVAAYNEAAAAADEGLDQSDPDYVWPLSPGNAVTDAGTPAKVLRIASSVARAYAKAGWIRPHSDGLVGNPADGPYAGVEGQVDIYLQDSGGDFFGLEAADWNHCDDEGIHCAGFIVLDANYASPQTTTGVTTFDTMAPLDNFRVTIAHEYEHVLQFAYDAWADGWLMESTAMWAETELYPQLNDNIRYLDESPLTNPGLSLDDNGYASPDPDAVYNEYGVWSFWRYVTDTIATSRTAGLPDFVRVLWEKVSTPGDNGYNYGYDTTSLTAADQALREVGSSLAEAYDGYVLGGLYPSRLLGANAHKKSTTGTSYPTRQPDTSVALTGAGTTGGTAAVNHLASYDVRYVPSGTALKGATLTLSVTLPADTPDQSVIVSAVTGSGAVKVFRPVPEDGVVTWTGSPSSYASVDVTLVNGTGIDPATCGTDPNWSFTCYGLPDHDGATFAYTATVAG